MVRSEDTTISRVFADCLAAVMQTPTAESVLAASSHGTAVVSFIQMTLTNTHRVSQPVVTVRLWFHLFR